MGCSRWRIRAALPVFPVDQYERAMSWQWYATRGRGRSMAPAPAAGLRHWLCFAESVPSSRAEPVPPGTSSDWLCFAVSWVRVAGCPALQCSAIRNPHSAMPRASCPPLALFRAMVCPRPPGQPHLTLHTSNLRLPPIGFVSRNPFRRVGCAHLPPSQIGFVSRSRLRQYGWQRQAKLGDGLPEAPRIGFVSQNRSLRVARANSFARGLSEGRNPSNPHRQTSWVCPRLLSSGWQRQAQLAHGSGCSPTPSEAPQACPCRCHPS